MSRFLMQHFVSMVGIVIVATTMHDPSVAGVSPVLGTPVQLTFPGRFHRAGESYISPDGRRVVFQAVETPRRGDPLSEFYSMFVADLVRDPAGVVTGFADIIRLSPDGSANTCGWFHPVDPDIVIFASTLTAPSGSAPPGYQRAGGRYRWMFPPEMTIVRSRLDPSGAPPGSLEVLVSNDEAYVAECSLSPDGRHLLYCSLASGGGDLFVKDLRDGETHLIVGAPGYDGGPFFSPDGRRICYRSDRRGNDLLQLFIAELVFADDGTITGVTREHQLTDDEHVNWAPFWHPGGRHLVYTTSAVSHRNYEVFMLDADPGDLPGSDGTIRYGTRVRRITFDDGFDGLPAFDASGEIMIWTSKRGEGGSSQLWAAPFLLNLSEAPGIDLDRDATQRLIETGEDDASRTDR